jgi:hypothetical protein
MPPFFESNNIVLASLRREGARRGSIGRSISTAWSEEGLNLAYLGARAEKQGFNIKLEMSFDPNAGEADVCPTRHYAGFVEFDFSDGFYAATKRQCG